MTGKDKLKAQRYADKIEKFKNTMFLEALQFAEEKMPEMAELLEETNNGLRVTADTFRAASRFK
jgi:hypothetical protein